jgi:CheY-like chemotaxis protein/anti-sigma regulatory factor (Ser/Thr protein kinase)
VRTIGRAGEHLSSLVDGLLELSRIEAGKLRLEQEAVSLESLFDDLVRMFRPLAAARGLAFHYRVVGRLPRHVHADSKRLRQVVINLVSNAIKFTDHGAVTLTVRHQRELGTISVHDTGPGIPAEDQARIFDPFERVTPHDDREGIGLGLAIVRLLADLMGGEIQVRSAPGEGSEFLVRLYLPAVSAAAVPRKDMPAPVVPTGARVLIVDDRVAHRAVLRGFLAPLDLAVREVGEGAQVMPALREWRPQLVLLDLNLPDASGWDLCRQIRAEQPTSQVVIVSANAHENTEEARLLHGYLGFVSKPVREPELIDMVHRALALAPAPQPAQPDDETLRELLAMGATGRLRAAEAYLAEMAQDGGAVAAWARQMLTLARTDAAALAASIGEALHATRS